MKKRILITAGILVAVCAIGAGGWYYLQNKGSTTTEGETAYVSAISTIMGLSGGTSNRYAGVVEPQETVEVEIESGRKVSQVEVKTGDVVTQGQLLFEYDLSSIQEDLQEAKLELDRLKNESVSLTAQIATLEKEKKEADKDSQLSYTIEIETNKMNLQKNQYDQTSKQAEIQRLQNATANTEVRSEIAGIVQKIDTTKISSDDGDSLEESGMGSYSMMGMGGEESNAFITILSTGAYRVKGSVNEQNRMEVMSMEGMPVLIRSRVDENQVWKGTMGAIDQENASTSNSSNMYYGMMDSSGDSQTSSSTYPFYVMLDTSEGLMLGQHVYIERDDGQEEEKEGLWLSDYYIVDADKENPYVWAADENDRLEKREVILGKHDDELAQFEIVEGLTESDSIAFPSDELAEGMTTVVGDGMQFQGDMGADSAEVPLEESDLEADSAADDAAMDADAVTEQSAGEVISEEVTLDESMSEDLAGADVIEENMTDMPVSEGIDSGVDLESMEDFDADMAPIGEIGSVG